MNGITVRVYSKAKNGNDKPYMSNGKRCTNFTVKEFACSDGSDPVFIAPELVTILQKIRNHFGKVNITGPYRTAAYNKTVKNASVYSQHQYGTASDIKVAGATPKEVAAYAEKLMPNKGGIGVYDTFTHIDVRAVKSRWNG